MNILITSPSLNPSNNVSGIATVVNTIIVYNKEHQYFHYLLGRQDKNINKFKLIMQLISQLVIFPWFVKRNEIELVHQNLPFNPKGLSREFVINCWCRIMRVPVLLHIHGGIFLMNKTNNIIFRQMAKSLFSHCKHVIVLSELEKDAIRNFYQFSSTTVLQNSVNTTLYKSGSKELPKKKPVLLFLGRIHESKGVEDIIEAFHLLKAQMGFRFLLCGAGPLKNQFVSHCEQLLGEDFEFLGIVSGQEKIDIIKQSHFFLLPSRYGEGLPMALLETMASGVVPIVTDDASMKSMVQHEINGIQVRKRDPKDLYEKMSEIMMKPDLYKELSEKAERKIAENYNIENYVVRLNVIYNNAMHYCLTNLFDSQRML